MIRGECHKEIVDAPVARLHNEIAGEAECSCGRIVARFDVRKQELVALLITDDTAAVTPSRRPLLIDHAASAGNSRLATQYRALPDESAIDVKLALVGLPLVHLQPLESESQAGVKWQTIQRLLDPCVRAKLLKPTKKGPKITTGRHRGGACCHRSSGEVADRPANGTGPTFADSKRPNSRRQRRCRWRWMGDCERDTDVLDPPVVTLLVEG